MHPGHITKETMDRVSEDPPVDRCCDSVELISDDTQIHDLMVEKVTTSTKETTMSKQTSVQPNKGYPDVPAKHCRDDSLAIFDLGEVIVKYQTWVKAFPRITPFYAIKCNNDNEIVKLIAACGSSFDCASKAEIEQVLDLGVAADRIIYAQTCKHPSMLKYAAKEGVALMTFDNEAELYKIKDIYPEAKCVLRIKSSQSYNANWDMGDKFGCSISVVESLMKCAKKLYLDVVGISFHVGSGCQEAEAFSAIIKESRDAFDIGIREGFDMKILDIGGGFPGDDTKAITFSEVVETVNTALDQYFPIGDSVNIIAEPGRYFVTTAVTLATVIIGKREETSKSKGRENNSMADPSVPPTPHFMYYMSEGLYGWLAVIPYHQVDVEVQTLKNNDVTDTYESSLWGPTCDSLDCIKRYTRLPELQIGEWLYIKSMGAYTKTTACSFNGMPGPRTYHYCKRSLWKMIHRD